MTDDTKSKGEQIAMSLDKAQLADEEIVIISEFIACELARDAISSNLETRGPDEI